MTLSLSMFNSASGMTSNQLGDKYGHVKNYSNLLPSQINGQMKNQSISLEWDD